MDNSKLLENISSYIKIAPADFNLPTEGVEPPVSLNLKANYEEKTGYILSEFLVDPE